MEVTLIVRKGKISETLISQSKGKEKMRDQKRNGNKKERKSGNRNAVETSFVSDVET